ncbi:RHS repeat-associated core domain-containing protein [Paenibacillus azoreducens]|uniref:RHS repeat-associated core domain-containing protein n=1 Tax=Paenibacillus azoreducens TaxID=116718 RepID=UPI0039F57F6E
MRRPIQILKNLVLGLMVFIIGSQFGSGTAHAAVSGDLMQSVLNGLLTPKLVNGSNKAQYSDRQLTSESIDPASGSLLLKETDLVLPGKDGLDLNIGRFYSSSQAEVGTKRVSVTETTEQREGYGTGYYLYLLYIVKGTNNIGVYSPGYYTTYEQAYNMYAYFYKNQPDSDKVYIQNGYDIQFDSVLYVQIKHNTNTKIYPDENSYSRLRYDLGGGWSFAFPSLQMDSGYIHYHDGNGGAYTVSFDGNRRGKLEDYGRTDVELLNDSSYSNGQVTSSYVLQEQDQKKTYFGSDGRLIGIKDRFGNEIKFTHINRTLNGSSYPVISKIVDSVGRNINFTYQTNLNDPDFDSKKMTENITISVTHSSVPSKAITLMYAKKRESVTISQNGSVIGKRYEPYLSSVTDQNGRSTYYNYYQALENFDAVSKSLSSSAGTAVYLLQYAMYPHSTTFYQYDKVPRNWGSQGAYQAFRVTSRWDGLNIYKYDQPNPSIVARGVYHARDYTYFGDVTGYPSYNSEEVIPESYRFGSEVVNNDQLNTKYTYNGKKQLLTTEQTATNGEKQIETIQSYDTNFKYKPTKIESKVIKGSQQDTLYTQYQYYSWGDLQSETKPLTASQLLDATKVKENTIRYEYDSSFKLPTKTESYQNSSTLLTSTSSYDSQGRLKTSTNENGEVTTINYATTTDGRTEEITKSLENGKTAKTLTLYGNTTSQLFPTSIKTYYTDDSGQLTASETKASYDLLYGVQTSSTDANNKTTTYQYDKYGRLTKTAYPVVNNQSGDTFQVEDIVDFYDQTVDSSPNNMDSENKYVVTTRVDSKRKITRISDNSASHDNVTRSFYDGFGNLILQGQYDGYTNKDLVMQQYHYDVMKRPKYVVDTYGNTSTVSYDGWGRPFEAIDPLGNLYKTDYDIINRKNTSYLVAATDIASFRSNPANTLKKNVLESYLDVWGREINRKAYPNWPSTAPTVEENFEYDYLGNVVGYTDPNRSRTSYTYDKLNRLTSVTDPLNQTTSYLYDSLGNLKSTVQTDGSTTWTTSKEYDETGFLKVSADASNSKDNFARNPLGQIAVRKDANNNSINYSYDEIGRTLIKNVNNTMLKNEYQFSSFGPVVQREYSSGSNIKNVVYGYDMLGNQKYKRDVYENADYETQHQYDYQSKLLNVTDPFNVVTQYKYDKTRLNRVQMNGASTINNADNANTKYEYEADGKLKSITYPTLANGAIIKSEYTYDSIGRLLKVVNKKNTEILSQYQYTYDNNGNITTVTDGTGATSYAYDKLNRLTQVTRPSGQTINYTYDARGNRSTFTSSGLSQSYSDITSTYNVWDQLESTTKDGLTTEYVYEMQGLRLSKTTDTSTTRYAYNNSGEVIAELNGTNQAIANYIWGPDRLLAKKEAATGKNYLYLYNGHGDVVQIIDPTGQVVNKYQYDEWGNILSEQEQIQNSFKYAGEILDEETGYYYLRARYYDPADGRFISKDTHEGQINNPLSLNLYTYVNNNPLINIDPSGNDAIIITNPNLANPTDGKLAGLSFGHTSLLLQNKNNQWYYFYWGDKDVKLVEIKDKSALQSLEALNKWGSGKSGFGGGGYQRSTYIKGDFSASITAAQKYADRYKDKYDGGDNLDYSLFKLNCVQVSSVLLGEGILYNGVSMHRFLGDYKDLVPNFSANSFENLFYNNAYTKSQYNTLLNDRLDYYKNLNWLRSKSLHANYNIFRLNILLGKE